VFFCGVGVLRFFVSVSMMILFVFVWCLWVVSVSCCLSFGGMCRRTMLVLLGVGVRWLFGMNLMLYLVVRILIVMSLSVFSCCVILWVRFCFNVVGIWMRMFFRFRFVILLVV